MVSFFRHVSTMLFSIDQRIHRIEVEAHGDVTGLSADVGNPSIISTRLTQRNYAAVRRKLSQPEVDALWHPEMTVEGRGTVNDPAQVSTELLQSYHVPPSPWRVCCIG